MSKLLILDANVIICAFKAGLWKTLVSRYQLVLPQIIVDESQYYLDSNNNKVKINITNEIHAGMLELIQPTINELESLCTRFKKDFIEGIDAGELHALSFLYSQKLVGYRFCTGDTPAIRAAAILGLTDCMVSFESILLECGLKEQSSKLKQHFKTKALQIKLGEGLRDKNMYEK